jgi:hypothetical protein
MVTMNAVQSQTTDRTVRDPRLVLDSALNRIFEGRDGIPEGDRRSLALTAVEHATANDAGQKFNNCVLASGYGYPDASIYDPRFPEQAARHKAALEQLLAKFKGREKLSEEENGEVRATIAPFVRYLEIQAQMQSGSIIIPPKTRCRFHFTSYCMDSSWAGPRGGEKMQLVPVETLLPGRLAEIYRDLVRRASLGYVNHADLQGLIWTLRQVAKDLKGEKAVTLSERQRRLLDEASPNGYAAFEAARRPLGRSALPKELEQLVRYEVEQAVGQMEKEGGYATRSMDSDELVAVVEQQLERIRAMPVNEPIPANNSHYTRLAPQVYARTVYGSLDVQVANDSDKPYTFDTASFVAQSERQVQRMGMVPDTKRLHGASSAFIVEVDRRDAGDTISAKLRVFNTGVPCSMLTVSDPTGNVIARGVVEGHIPIPTSFYDLFIGNQMLLAKQIYSAISGEYGLFDDRNPANSTCTEFFVTMIPKGSTVLITKRSNEALVYNFYFTCLELIGIVGEHFITTGAPNDILANVDGNAAALQNALLKITLNTSADIVKPIVTIDPSMSSFHKFVSIIVQQGRLIPSAVRENIKEPGIDAVAGILAKKFLSESVDSILFKYTAYANGIVILARWSDLVGGKNKNTDVQFGLL